MANELSFDTGIKEYKINGVAIVRFNPTDTVFVEKIYNLFTELDAKQEQFEKDVDAVGDDGEKMFAYSKARDAEMREAIDCVLGEGVADKLFPDMNCYALGNGLPIWINLMFVLVETVEKAFSEEHKKGDPRLKKLSKKYSTTVSKYKNK